LRPCISPAWQSLLVIYFRSRAKRGHFAAEFQGWIEQTKPVIQQLFLKKNIVPNQQS
jgi:DNA/RNA endonuclease G (NUC1)